MAETQISFSGLKGALRNSHRKQSKATNKWMTGGKRKENGVVRPKVPTPGKRTLGGPEDLEGGPFPRARARIGPRRPGHSQLYPKASCRAGRLQTLG